MNKENKRIKDEKDDNVVLSKIMVLGDSDSGKTSFMNRYVHDFFSAKYKNTIGVDFALSEFTVKDGTNKERNFKIQLWEVAGSERYSMFTGLCKIYYRNSDAAIVCFDLSNADNTLEGALNWVNDFREIATTPDSNIPTKSIPILLLGTKSDIDLGKEMVTDEKLDEICSEHNIWKWKKISSKRSDELQYIKDIVKEFVLHVHRYNHLDYVMEQLREKGEEESKNDEEMRISFFIEFSEKIEIKCLFGNNLSVPCFLRDFGFL